MQSSRTEPACMRNRSSQVPLSLQLHEYIHSEWIPVHSADSLPDARKQLKSLATPMGMHPDTYSSAAREIEKRSDFAARYSVCTPVAMQPGSSRWIQPAARSEEHTSELSSR